MSESKAGAWRRLAAEGRWDKARDVRKKLSHKYRKETGDWKRANELAWQEMLRLFPPMTPQELRKMKEAENLNSGLRNKLVRTQLTGKPTTTVLEDIDFARSHMHLIEDPSDYNSWQIMPSAAPSASAWNMLIHAVRNTSEFIKMTVALDKERREQEFKMRLAKVKTGEMDDLEQPGSEVRKDRMTKMYDKMIREMREQAIEETSPDE